MPQDNPPDGADAGAAGTVDEEERDAPAGDGGAPASEGKPAEPAAGTAAGGPADTDDAEGAAGSTQDAAGSTQDAAGSTQDAAAATGTDAGAAGERADEPAGAVARLRARTTGTVLPAALAAVTVVLAAVAVWSGLRAHDLRTSAAARNTALTDNATTSEVNGQVATAVNTIFSYDYNNLDRTQQAAQTLLTGQAICQYNALFKVVREQAPKQKLVVTVTVTDSAVELLQGDRARVLVFATQSDVRTSTRQSASAAAMFAVDAVHREGRWKIEGIDTFTGEQGAERC